MGKEKVNEEMKARVFNALEVGKRNAVSRRALTRKTGLGDRQVREAIEYLRHRYAILTLENGKGYYLPTQDAQGCQEAAKWIAMQNHRAKSIKMAQRGAQRFIQLINGGA